MAGKFLLDTTIAVAILENERQVVRQFAEADEAYLSVIALGELIYGARRSARSESNLKRVQTFAGNIITLDVDATTAHQFGEFKSRLQERGRPIPDNDIRIAAIASQHGLTLATRDDHFNEIPNLALARW